MSDYITITSGSQHLDRYGVYHFDAQIDGAHQFGAVFGWYTGTSIGSTELKLLPVHSSSTSLPAHAQLYHNSGSLLELQVKLIGISARPYDIIFSRLV